MIEELIQSESYDEVKGLLCFSKYHTKGYAPYHHYAQSRVDELIKEAAKQQFSILISTGQYEKMKKMVTHLPDCAEILFGCAAVYGCPENLKYCIKDLGISAHNCLEDKMPPLFYAIAGENFENVKFLVEECGVNLNSSVEARKINGSFREINGSFSKDIVTPLSMATARKNFQITNFLIDNKANLCEESFCSAVASGNCEMVELLIQCGAKINNDKTIGEDSTKFNKAAVSALLHGHLKILKLLLSNGALLPSSKYAFGFAGISGNIALLKYIFEELNIQPSKEFVEKNLKNVIKVGSVEILKYIKEKYQIDVKNMLIKELESNKEMWGDCWWIENLFTSFFKCEEGSSIPMLTYLFDELKAYPSLKQLAFHIQHAPDKLYEKSYLLSLTSTDEKQKKAFSLIADKKFDQIGSEALKDIYANKERLGLKPHFLYRIRKIMEDRVADNYLIRTLSLFPKEVVKKIASDAELAYPFS